MTPVIMEDDGDSTLLFIPGKGEGPSGPIPTDQTLNAYPIAMQSLSVVGKSFFIVLINKDNQIL